MRRVSFPIRTHLSTMWLITRVCLSLAALVVTNNAMRYHETVSRFTGRAERKLFDIALLFLKDVCDTRVFVGDTSHAWMSKGVNLIVTVSIALVALFIYRACVPRVRLIPMYVAIATVAFFQFERPTFQTLLHKVFAAVSSFHGGSVDATELIGNGHFVFALVVLFAVARTIEVSRRTATSPSSQAIVSLEPRAVVGLLTWFVTDLAYGLLVAPKLNDITKGHASFELHAAMYVNMCVVSVMYITSQLAIV